MSIDRALGISRVYKDASYNDRVILLKCPLGRCIKPILEEVLG